jgi:hypothetical protein
VRTALDRLEAESIIQSCDPAVVAAKSKRADQRPQGWDAAGVSAPASPLAGRRLIGRRRLGQDADGYEAGGMGGLSAGPAVGAR